MASCAEEVWWEQLWAPCIPRASVDASEQEQLVDAACFGGLAATNNQGQPLAGRHAGCWHFTRVVLQSTACAHDEPVLRVLDP